MTSGLFGSSSYSSFSDTGAFHDHAKSLGELLYSGNFSDLIIQCDKRTWKVHRAIVCQQSEFLSSACNGSFEEARDGIITLPARTLPGVDAMINFFYKSTYDHSPNEPQKHVHAYIVAVKYKVASLQRYSSGLFRNAILFNDISNEALANVVELVYDERLLADDTELKPSLSRRLKEDVNLLMNNKILKDALARFPLAAFEVLERIAKDNVLPQPNLRMPPVVFSFGSTSTSTKPSTASTTKEQSAIPASTKEAIPANADNAKTPLRGKALFPYPATAPTPSLFEFIPAASQDKPSGSTNEAKTPSPFKSLFGDPATAPTPTLFGATPAPTRPSLFGASVTTASASGKPPTQSPSTLSAPPLFGTQSSSSGFNSPFAGFGKPKTK